MRMGENQLIRGFTQIIELLTLAPMALSAEVKLILALGPFVTYCQPSGFSPQCSTKKERVQLKIVTNLESLPKGGKSFSGSSQTRVTDAAHPRPAGSPSTANARKLIKILWFDRTVRYQLQVFVASPLPGPL